MSEVIIPHNHNLGDTTSNIEVDTDFIGFTFNGKHSSELGIVRTSDGSRFNESLLPVISDKTVQVPGADGTYYFGSNYTHRVFDIPFAFDSLTEKQFQDLKRWLGDKKIHDLIFDEAPYKIYRAKITGSATIKHIPFSEGDTNRIYKGEGNIQFTAYDPFARSAFKYLSQASDEQKKHLVEWKDAAKMQTNQGNFDTIKLQSANTAEGTLAYRYFNLYNPGDKEADFVLSFKFSADSNQIPGYPIELRKYPNQKIYGLTYSNIIKKGDDDEVRFNSRLNLIEGYKNGFKTGNVYNQHIIEGEFFKIPITVEKVNPMQLVINSQKEIGAYEPTIAYDYYYF